MPLRDHFRPPLDDAFSWEGFHAQWPAMVVQELAERLPLRFTAEPRVHLGTSFEIDVGPLEGAGGGPWSAEPAGGKGGGGGRGHRAVVAAAANRGAGHRPA